MNKRHYDTPQWIDFVRDLMEPITRAAMEDHLSSPCHKCARTVELLRKLLAKASAEAGYAVPPHVLHYAKTIHSLQPLERVQILPRTYARLVFDSFREPLPAGIRSQRKITRHSIYHAADYQIQLRQEHERGGSQVNLIGQISNEKKPGGRMSRLEILLLSGKEIIARAISNQFGEFIMAHEPKAHLRLCVKPFERLPKAIPPKA